MTHSSSAPSAQLPDRPSLELLGSLAKRLRKDIDARDPQAIDRLKSRHPRFLKTSNDQISKASVSLRDAQLVIAREYGFEHWAALKKHVLSLHDAGSAALVDALIAASARGDLAEVTKILDANPRIINTLGGAENQQHNTTALHPAAYRGHLDVVKLLLDRGADPTIRDVGDNATALHFAAENGSLPIVKLLVDHGADVNGFGDLHGWDVIGFATLNRHTHADVARYLLENGARHNIFTAVATGDVEAIKSLAAVSRDVLDKPMAVWEFRRRPLHLAIHKKQPAAATALLDLGADIEATDVEGFTPLDEAALMGQTEIANLLIGRGANIGLPAAFGLRRNDLIDRLLSEDPNSLKPGGRWGKLIAQTSNCAAGDIIETMIAHGASVQSRADSKAFGTKNYTPLHDAAFAGNLDAMRVLIKHGAEIEARDNTYDGTPLGWARFAGRTDAVELLRSHGAKT